MKIPEAALDQHIAALGKTGSGKSYAVKAVVIEPLLKAGRRVGIVDPTDAWWGLKSSADGKGPGFSILVMGGDHGDMPLPPNSGAAVARLLIEQGVNLVASTKHLTVGERTRWFIDFAGTINRINRSPLHLVLDEAHNFAPQGKVHDPESGKMLHAANTLASAGRSMGIRLVMISQRPQKLHKDTLTCADTLIAMRVLLPHDREAVEDWIDGCADPAKGKQVVSSLAGLARGEGWVWYPEGAFLERMKFPAIRTFDSSATPTGDQAPAAPKGVAQLDLTEIKAALADAVKEAEANDPKLLRARIAQLEREAKKQPVAAPDEKALDDVWKQGHASGKATGRACALEELAPHIEALHNAAAIAKASDGSGRSAPPWATSSVARPDYREAQSTKNIQAKRQLAILLPAEGITAPQQRVLDALAWWASVGVDRPDKGQVGFIAGYRVGKNVGGTFGNLLGQLRAQGLIDYPSPGTAALTDAGRKVARTPAEAPTTEALQGAIRARLDGTEWRVLSALIEAYPSELTKQDCGTRSGYTVGENVGGTFGNILGRLRSLGLVEYPSPGRVVAQPVLFL